MAANDVTEPVPFTEAFARDDDPAVLSRAAALLLLGAQMESEPVAREAVLPLWFDHSASHDPEVWRRHDVPNRL